MEITELLGGAMKVRARGVNNAGLTGGVFIDLWPRDSCPPSAPSISNSKTLDQCHVSMGKMVIFTNDVYTMNLTLEGTTWRNLWWIPW
jgi:hypothetical protein